MGIHGWINAGVGGNKTSTDMLQNQDFCTATALLHAHDTGTEASRPKQAQDWTWPGIVRPFDVLSFSQRLKGWTQTVKRSIQTES